MTGFTVGDFPLATGFSREDFAGRAASIALGRLV